MESLFFARMSIRSLLVARADRRKREKYERKASYDKHEKHEKKDKKDKKKKKDKHKDFDALGDEVVSSEKSEDVPYGVTSDDPTTLRNTLQNSATSLSGANGVQDNGEDDALSPKSPSDKMVSFDSQPSIIDTTSKKELVESDSSNSSDSDSMSDSSSSDDNKPLTRVSDNSAVRTTMPLRKIKAVGSKIHVLTASGQAYECERYCPHKVICTFCAHYLAIIDQCNSLYRVWILSPGVRL